MFPFIAVATVAYIAAFILAPPVDIDGIREPVAGTFNFMLVFQAEPSLTHRTLFYFLT